VPQLTFSFYRHQPIRADFSGGQITSDAGLLPLRAFDQRHHLTRDWAEGLRDRRQTERVQHDAPVLLRQRIYQTIAGHQDAKDADRLRHDPLLQVVTDQKWRRARLPAHAQPLGECSLGTRSGALQRSAV